MINKAQLIPGMKLEIISGTHKQWGIANMQATGGDKISALGEPGYDYDRSCGLSIGTVVEYIEGPKRYSGINSIKVLFNNEEWFCYWAEFKFNTKIIMSKPLLGE